MAAGTVYLLHFDQPYKHARHYVGWTARTVRCRLAEHEAGRGARLLAVVRAAGIGWQLARLLARRAGPGAAAQAAGRPRPQVPAVRRQAAVPCRATGTGRCRAAGPPTRRRPRPG